MKLLLNLMAVGPQLRGIGRYALACAEAAGAHFDCEAIAGAALELGIPRRITSPPSIAMGGGIGSAVRRYAWARTVRAAPDDLVYSPSHHAVGGAPRQVITVHDVIPLRFPSQFRHQHFYWRRVLPKAIRHCAAVFTVSETSRQDLAAYLDVDLARIFVVPNAVVRRGVMRRPVPAGGARPFLLMVGANAPHKNAAELLRMSHLWRKEFDLVIVGSSKAHLDDLNARRECREGLKRARVEGYVTQARLDELYAGCASLVFPSLWEGFGLPPLEALAVGAPVIVSDIPAHRETLLDCASFVRLNDEGSWKAALDGVLAGRHPSCDDAAVARLIERWRPEAASGKLRDALLAVEPGLGVSPANSLPLE